MSASAEPLATFDLTKANADRQALLGAGWWEPEDDGVWTGREASATLSLPALPPEGAVLLLVTNGLLPAHFREGGVRVAIGGRDVRVVPLGTCLVCDVPEEQRGEAATVLIEAAARPAAALFGGEDERDLGVKLSRVEVHAAPADPVLDLRSYPRYPEHGPLAEQPPADFVRINPGRNGFETAAGERWAPFGCNYFDPHTDCPPQIWARFNADEVERHYAVMQELGANCVRIFLANGALLKTPFELDEATLRKVDEMVAIARRHGIRIMFTVADSWEPGHYPECLRTWECNEQLFSWLSRYCQVLGARYAGESTIFAWDLRNEPMVLWDAPPSQRWLWREWLQEQYGGLAELQAGWGAQAPASWETVPMPPDQDDPGSRRLYDYQCFREHLARQWVQCQVEGLRWRDRTHPIGVGFIQWSLPAKRMAWAPAPSGYGAYNAPVIADLVDYQMMHFYPMYGNPADGERQLKDNLLYARAALQSCHVGQPVILAEYGWYGGAPDDPERDRKEQLLADYCQALIEATQGLACGWLCWPFADAPSVPDLSATGGMVRDTLQPEPWGLAFQRLAAERRFAPQQMLGPELVPPPLSDRQALLTSDVACQRVMHTYIRNNDPTAGVLTANRLDMSGASGTASPSLGWGFSGVERVPEAEGGFEFQWATGREAGLSVVLPDAAEGLVLRLCPSPGVPDQQVTTTVNGQELPPLELEPGWHEYELTLPPGLVRGGERTELVFAFRGAAPPSPPAEGEGDRRTLAVACDYLEFTR